MVDLIDMSNNNKNLLIVELQNLLSALKLFLQLL